MTQKKIKRWLYLKPENLRRVEEKASGLSELGIYMPTGRFLGELTNIVLEDENLLSEVKDKILDRQMGFDEIKDVLDEINTPEIMKPNAPKAIFEEKDVEEELLIPIDRPESCPHCGKREDDLGEPALLITAGKWHCYICGGNGVWGKEGQFE